MLAADILECEGKLVYVNAAEAHRALGRIQKRTRRGRADVKPYRCSDCGGWHLGREKRMPRGRDA